MRHTVKNKYNDFSDEDLLKEFRKPKLANDDKHLLQVELMVRDLLDKAEEEKVAAKRAKPFVWNWKKIMIGVAVLVLGTMKVITLMNK